VLAVHNPARFAVFNKPVAGALKKFKYERPRGAQAQHYLDFTALMRRFLKESGCRSTLDLDAFFYKYWDKHVKAR